MAFNRPLLRFWHTTEIQEGRSLSTFKMNWLSTQNSAHLRAHGLPIVTN